MPTLPQSDEASAAEWKAQRKDTQLKESMGLATQAGVDPTVSRRAEVVSQDLGIPFSAAEEYTDEAEATRDAMKFNTELMQRDTPRVAEWMSDPKRARLSIDDLEAMEGFERYERRRGNYWGNLALGMGERANSLTGNLIRFAGMSVSGYEQMIEARFGLDAGSLGLSEKIDHVGKAIAQGGLGYEQQYSWEDFKEAPSVLNLAAYAMETGGQSLVDIGGMMATLPAYLASRSVEIGEERAMNEGREDVDPLDVLKAMPTAVAVTVIDRFSAKGALGLLDGQAKKLTLKHAAQEVGRATGREAMTEFVQEQIEYVGAMMGTEKAYSTPHGVQLIEQLDRGFAGMFAGGPMGGALRAATLPLDAVNLSVRARFEKDMATVNEQQGLDHTIENLQSMKLQQEAPEVAREFFKDMGEDATFFITPEGLDAAKEAGIAIPQFLQDAAKAGTDIALTVEQFAMDVLNDDQLTEVLRPHMKRSADTFTQYEIQNRDGSKLERLMNMAKEDATVKTEADEIYEEVAEQLVQSGRLSRGVANMSAQIIPAYVTTKVTELQGRGHDVTPREIYEEMNFSVAPAPNAKAKPKKEKVKYEPPAEIENAPEITPTTDTSVTVTPEQVDAAIVEAGVLPPAPAEEAIPETAKPQAKPKGKAPKKAKVKIQHANPRIDMYFKEVTQRIPQLTEAAKLVESGEMTTEEYARLVNEHKPVTPYEFVPTPNTNEEIDLALTKNKKPKIGEPGKLEEGHNVGVRLDIPAYRDHGVWAVSVHEPGAGFKAGKSIGYDSVALVTEGKLGAHEPMSMKIATGQAKSTIAVVKGKWKNITPEAAVELANEALLDPAWIQVGYDPERHSYFYNRATMEPVVEGAEVLQVGPLTLVKAPVYGDPSDFLFQEELSDVEGRQELEDELAAYKQLLNCTRGA